MTDEKTRSCGTTFVDDWDRIRWHRFSLPKPANERALIDQLRHDCFLVSHGRPGSAEEIADWTFSLAGRAAFLMVGIEVHGDQAARKLTLELLPRYSEGAEERDRGRIEQMQAAWQSGDPKARGEIIDMYVRLGMMTARDVDGYHLYSFSDREHPAIAWLFRVLEAEQVAALGMGAKQ